MDFLSYAVFFIAAVLLAVDTGIKQSSELSARAPAFMKGPLWGFAPLFLLVIAGLIWIVKAANYEFSGPQAPSASVASESETPAEPAPPPLAAENEPNATSTVPITLDSKLKDAMSLFNGRTQFQADALLKDKLGQKVTVSGPVNEILYDSEDGTGSILFLEMTPKYLRLDMYFSKSWSDRLAALKLGDVVTVSGKILDVDSSSATLTDCRITGMK